MTFSSQLDARQFLINKITAQASQNGTALSDAETRMLQLNLDEPGSAIGIPVEVLEDKSRTFENKAVRLLKAAFNRDRDDAQEEQRYKDALRRLRDSDHYILIIATAALPRPKNWSRLLVYLLIVLAMAAMIVVLEMW